MTAKQRVYTALRHEQPDICPWHFEFTVPAHRKMVALTGDPDFERKIGNHLHYIRAVRPDVWVEIAPDFWRDQFGVVWNRTIDKDIGNPHAHIFTEPTLGDYVWPDPDDPVRWAHVPGEIAAHPDQFVVIAIDFSLFERAWTMRGMENLMMDFIENPKFVHELLGAITDYNIAQVRKALEYDIDAVYFGDDWGQQSGLQMGKQTWDAFILPQLKRMYGTVRGAGKKVFIHSCGDVDELFDDLIAAGVNCFNPFQPEVMDVASLLVRYRGRLTFHGGLSTQRTLPYGTAEEVRRECRRLLDLGGHGSYILAPAHAVEGDVPLENMLAFIDLVQQQKGALAEAAH